MIARVLVTVAALYYFVVGVFLGGIVHVFTAGMACDEGCGGTHWSRDREAWQWDGLLVLSLAGIAAGILVLAAWPQPRIRLLFFAVQATATAAAFAVVDAAEVLAFDNEFALLIASAEAAGLVAVLSPHRRARSS